MAKEVMLFRMADKISAYITRYVTLAGPEKREEVFELFDKMQLFFPHWVISTCPMMHPSLYYISSNHFHILGQEISADNGRRIENYFNHIHPADLEDVQHCFNFIHDVLEAVPPELHCQYRCVFQYRFRKQNGQYMLVHDEKAVLNLRGSGNLYYNLLSDISAEKQFSGVKVEVFKQEGKLHKISECKPSSGRSSLSKREGELVTLIKQGLSTKEIAWYLKISHHTVRNIKSKLFEKFNVNNTVELLNMTA